MSGGRPRRSIHKYARVSPFVAAASHSPAPPCQVHHQPAPVASLPLARPSRPRRQCSNCACSPRWWARRRPSSTPRAETPTCLCSASGRLLQLRYPQNEDGSPRQTWRRLQSAAGDIRSSSTASLRSFCVVFDNVSCVWKSCK